MTFREIAVLSVDTQNIEQVPGTRPKAVLVPYTLSEAPTDEWIRIFVARVDPWSAAEVVRDRAYYRCLQNKTAIMGVCRKRVEQLVKGANKYCRERAAREEQESEKERDEERQSEREREEFERWKRESWD